MDTISQVIHECETCAANSQAKWVKPQRYGGRWLKYKYGEAWQIDYITPPQIRQGNSYVLTKVEATTGWLETYPVPQDTARNTGTFKNWDMHLAMATWLVNTRGFTNQAGPAQSKLPCPVEGDTFPVEHLWNILGKTVSVGPALGKGKSVHGTAFAQGPGCTWWVMQKDGEFGREQSINEIV